MGERPALDTYIRLTQGCSASGWPDDQIRSCGELARQNLDALGIAWGTKTETELMELEGRIDVADAPDAIQEAAAKLEG
jgi:hypothetical protein